MSNSIVNHPFLSTRPKLWKWYSQHVAFERGPNTFVQGSGAFTKQIATVDHWNSSRQGHQHSSKFLRSVCCCVDNDAVRKSISAPLRTCGARSMRVIFPENDIRDQGGKNSGTVSGVTACGSNQNTNAWTNQNKTYENQRMVPAISTLEHQIKIGHCH